MGFITDYTIYFDEMNNHKFDLTHKCDLRISFINYSLMEVNTFLIEHQKEWGSYLVNKWSETQFVTTYRAFIYFDHALKFCGVELDIDTTKLLELWEAKALAFTMVEASA